MKKAPKIPKQKLAELAKTPSFWESLQFTQGSYAKAGKKLKIAPSILSRLGRTRTRFEKAPELSDATLEKLQKALKRLDKRDYDVAKRFAYVPANEEFIRGASKVMTPGQIAYAKKYAARGPKQAAYFRKAVNDYYTHKTSTVRMGAIGPDGTVYQPRATSPSVKRVRKGGKRSRATSPSVKRVRKGGKRAFRRARRRGNK